MLLHIGHVGLVASAEPFFITPFLLGQRSGNGYAAGIETYTDSGLFHERGGEGGGFHGLVVVVDVVVDGRGARTPPFYGRDARIPLDTRIPLFYGRGARSPGGTVLFQAPFEEFELEETAVKLAVEQGYLFGGLQSDVFHGFEVGGDEPHFAVFAVSALEGVA